MVPLLCSWFNLVLGSPKPWGGTMWIYQGENQMWKISFNQYWVLNCLGLLGVEEYCPNLYSALMWRVLKGERKIVVRRMQCLLFSWSSSKTTWLIVFKCACHTKCQRELFTGSCLIGIYCKWRWQWHLFLTPQFPDSPMIDAEMWS